MSHGQSEEVVDAIENISLQFFKEMEAFKLNEHYMASAYASLIRVLLDTVSQNTSPHVAVRLAVVVIEQFVKDKPGLNVIVHEQITPPRGAMQ